jgi:E3 ubiquitin-protein ligase NEDD4
MYGKSESPCD